jgi:hypothetical protein
VPELDENNNCLATQMITVARPTLNPSGTLALMSPLSATQVARVHSRFKVATTLRLPAGAEGPTTVSYYLARKPLLTSRRTSLTPNGPSRQAARRDERGDLPQGQ